MSLLTDLTDLVDAVTKLVAEMRPKHVDKPLVRQHGWSNDGLGGVLCLYCRTPKTTANEHERCPAFT